MKNNTPALLDRDLSILSFNARVLSLAERADYPLLERLRFMCIVSHNLDEFFEVRMPLQMEAHQQGITLGPVTANTCEQVAQMAHALVAQQYQLFNEALMPALAKEGVHLVSGSIRTPEQTAWVASYFKREVLPFLMPVSLDPSHPFPQVANKSLNFIVRIAVGDEERIAIVRAPRVVPRVVQLPPSLSKGEQRFVSLTSIIRANLDVLFEGATILHFSQFRVTRNSDLDVDEDDVINLRMALREELAHRQYGEAVRLEVTQECDSDLADFLLKQFNLPALALYRVNGPVNLGRLIQLPDMAKGDHLKFVPFHPQWPREIKKNQSIIAQMQGRDLLMHQPYESFDVVIQLLEEAVLDDQVLAIRMTIYRTGADPRMLRLLQEAVGRGKEVLVVVELKARFDEEANINWAEALESVGAQVVYGVVGLKTHAKMLLIMRREGKTIQRYGHLSTGNYNPKTTRLYTDWSMLTANPNLTKEMEAVFRHLTSELPLPVMRHLLVAPFTLQTGMIRQLEKAQRVARQGKPARVIAKMNALTDVPLVQALIKAATAGVEIDLIVRGACILPVSLPALQGRIRVRSVVGRLLEHSRVFYFALDGQVQMWLSSADWMSRNMTRRVELAWPITDPAMQQRILQESLQMYLEDTLDAWQLNERGEYTAVRDTTEPLSRQGCQNSLLKQYQPR
ncbi:polyphosphate kinase 1 [Methylophilus aquaticus]|uniref:Polyphosphate kinase n=1 Tax=Methylophilus aquaticus TaxID=1971610 RepID=A0ABT9JTT2_9PROT|nr:polyphosphate kinase 1 [Methylophilus aquaticus]MDP8567993.1 polyphosphate kinase 1 [Methylophilus aquaticus]